MSSDRLPPFAVALRDHRRQAGLTQEELARAARVGVRTLRDLETGRAVRPQRSTVELLATALGLDGAVREEFLAMARAGRASPRPPAGRLRPAPDLIGRGTMVLDIGELVGVANVVTLVGLAGVGKTALALNVGHAVAERFGMAVGGLVVTETSTEAEILASALSALRLGRIDELATRYADAPGLLVVDAADRSSRHAAAACERLRRSAPGLHLLVTSRHPLGLADEHEWPVPPLDVPPATARGAAVLEYPATRLFLERLRRVRRRAVGPGETETLGALVRRLGGLPLALELTAARGRVLELAEMLARSASLRPEGDAVGDHLRDAVLASWGLLSLAEQACLGRLATFQWRWSLELAEEMLAGMPASEPAGQGGRTELDVVALIDRLVGLGMVSMRSDGAEMRFWLLDAVREVALECAAQAGQLIAARDRHAAVLGGIAVRTTALLARATGAEAETIEQRLDGLIPDLHAALDHLRQRPATAGDDAYLQELRADLEHCRAVLRASSQRWHDVRGLPREDLPE